MKSDGREPIVWDSSTVTEAVDCGSIIAVACVVFIVALTKKSVKIMTPIVHSSLFLGVRIMSISSLIGGTLSHGLASRPFITNTEVFGYLFVFGSGTEMGKG